MRPHPSPPKSETPMTWRERLAALKRLPPLLRMVWETNPWLCVSSLALRVVLAFVPFGSLLVGRRIINDVVALIMKRPVPPNDVWYMIGAGFALAAASDVLTRGIALSDSLLGDRFSYKIDIMVMEHAAALDLASFEDPVFYDKMERARQQARGRIGMLVTLSSMLRQSITLLTMIATVAAFSPWLLLLAAVSTIPVFVGETRFAYLNYTLLFRQTPAKRELEYIRFLGASRHSAKEVKIFGLGGYLSQRFRAIFEGFYADNRKLAVQRAIHGTLIGVIPSVAYYGTYAYVVKRAVEGALTVGDLTLVTGAFSRARDIMEQLVNQLVDTSEQALYLKDLFEFLEARPTLVNGTRPAPRPIRRGFEFRNVSFAYPGSKRPVVHNLSFTLGPGEKIALVGENGAGKTTITKLLARLYDPTAGQILLDGIDLKEYDADDLRREIGVIFQDYVRYDMTVRQNVGFGKIAEVDNEAKVVASATKSLASDVVEKLPSRYDQMLGRRFDGGVDLSTGQWQKVALARAYMREAQLLILDEPTASLDARAEFEAYERFVELSEGKMAVLISHRFSTVRMAAKIVVLDDGRIVEMGSHDELVALQGRYADLFELQAKGYR